MAKQPRTRNSGFSDYQLYVRVADSEPLIWRRVLVPGEFTLGMLHTVFQLLMGWENCHLHAFTVQKKRYADPAQVVALEDEDEDELDENRWTLADVLSRARMKLLYEYDFGDSWTLDVTVEKVIPADPERPRVPVCLEGMLAGPPDDTGGIWNYQQMVEALKNPDADEDEELEDYREILGEDFDPEAFSAEEINRQLAKVSGKKKPPSRKASASKAAPARVWAGTAIDASSVAGVSDGRTPVLAVWFDVTDPEDATLASVWPGFAEDEEPALLRALLNPLPTASAPSGRPGRLQGATREDLHVLKQLKFESMAVDTELVPELKEWAEEVLEDFGDMMETGPEHPLSDSVPVPGEESIDEAFSRSWCEATLAFYKAKPWKRIRDAELFEVLFEDGESRIVSIIGHSGEVFGLLLYETREDEQAMTNFALQAISGLPPQLEFLPRVLSLNFDPREDHPKEIVEYLATYGPEWEREKLVPTVLKVGGAEPDPPSAADFRNVGRTAAALGAYTARFQKSRSWPPKAGQENQVEISWAGQTPESVRIRFLSA